MIPLYASSPHVTEAASSSSQQASQISKTDTLSVANLFSLGISIVIIILVSRQLVVNLYQKYQLHRLIISLQRRARLEQKLYRKSSTSTSNKRYSRRI
jgi:hypothetical protein